MTHVSAARRRPKRRLLAGLLAGATAVTGLTVLPASPASALAAPALTLGQTIQNPPVAGHTLTVFPAWDFVSASGYPADANVFVEVWRGNTLIGSVPNLTPEDLPSTPGFDGVIEVNHPGNPCWGPLVGVDATTSVTPDITAGDQVRITYTHPDGTFDALGAPNMVTRADAMIVEDIVVTQGATAIGVDTVEFSGRAAREGVTPFRALDARSLIANIRSGLGAFNKTNRVLISADSDPTAALNPQDVGVLTVAPDGSFKATFTGLDALDMERALTGALDITWAAGPTATQIADGPGGDAAGPQGGCIPFDPAVPASVRPPLNAPVARTGDPLVVTPARAEGAAAGAVATATVRNIGVGSASGLTVTAARIEGIHAADFEIVADTCISADPRRNPLVIPSGGSCTVSVRLRATATAGQKEARLFVNSDSAEGVLGFDVVGFVRSAGSAAHGRLFAYPDTLIMAAQSVGVTSPASAMRIVNIGDAATTAPLTATLTGANAAAYKATPAAGCNVLAPNASCDVNVTVTPLAEGTQTATATLRAGAADTEVAPLFSSAGLTITNVVPADGSRGVAITTFSGREFAFVSGLVDGFYTVQVIRHGSVIGYQRGVESIFGGLEINHPGTPCWAGTTPDIRAGDRVRIVPENPGAQLPIFQSTVANIEALPNPDDPATAVRRVAGQPGTIEIIGRARDAAGNPLPIGEIGFELVAGSANKFDFNATRAAGAPGDGTIEYLPKSATNPDGTLWVARFEGLGERDIVRAMYESEQAALGGSEGGSLTINEFGAGPEGCSPVAPDVAVPPLMAKQAETSARPTSLVLPSRSLTGSVNRPVSILNTGDAPLAISDLVVGGANAADFRVLPGSNCLAGAIPVGEQCSMAVEFAPQGGPLGIRSAHVLIEDNVSGQHRIPISSRAVADGVGFVSIDAAPQVFADTPVGLVAKDGLPPAEDIRTLTIANGGQQALTITGIATTGASKDDFVLGGTAACTATIPVDGTCDITVSFVPKDLGDRTATLTINSSDPDSPSAISLRGSSTQIQDEVGNIVNDPPRKRSVAAFSVRDYVHLAGYPAGAIVDVTVLRATAGGGTTVVGNADNIIVSAAGTVDINIGGGACWAGQTPDLRAGDTIRVVAFDQSGTVISRDQSYVQDIVVETGVTKVDASTVEFSGTVSDARTGAAVSTTPMEGRITSRAASFSNGRKVLRTGLDGIFAFDPQNPKRWTATFRGLTPADVALALGATTQPKMLWLGRNMEAGVEATHYEWNETPGAQVAACPAANGGALEFRTAIGAGTVLSNPTNNTPAALGVSGTGARAVDGQVGQIRIVNIGNAATRLQQISTVGADAGSFTVIPGTAVGQCVPGTTSLAPGASCLLQVRVTAERLGALQTSVRVDHTGINNPEFVAVSGTGVAAPTISSFTPARGGSGTRVTVTGENFTSATTIRLPDTASGAALNAPVTVVNDTTATFTVPDLTAVQIGTGLTGPLTITTVAGNGTSTASFTVAPNPPAITALTPLTAPIVAGTAVRVSGTNLGGASAATVGGIAATIQAGSVSADGSSLIVVIPDGAPATSNVALTTSTGVVTSTATIAVAQAPRITAVSVASARIGGRLVVTGTAFNATTTLRINGGLATITARTATTLTTTVPATAEFGATPAPALQVTNTVGTAPSTATVSSTSTIFTVLAAPRVTALTTDGGAACTVVRCTAVNRTITITGTGFVGVTGVNIGAVGATGVTVVSPTEIRATVPARVVAGVQQVSVVTRGGTGTSGTALTVTVVGAPTITAFVAIDATGRANTPATTSAGTFRTVAVTGTNLQHVTALEVGNRPVAFTRVGAGATQQLRFTVTKALADSLAVTGTAATSAVFAAVKVTDIAGSATSTVALRIERVGLV